MRHDVLKRILTVGLVAGVSTALVAADQAKPRGSSGSSSSAGSRHPSSGSSSSRSSSSSSSKGSGGGGGESYRGSPSSRPLSPAEARHPRAGTGTGYRGYYYAPGWGYWYAPGYYPGYYYGYWPYYGYGSGLYYGAGYWGGYGGAYYSSGSYGPSTRHDSDTVQVRVLVDPEDAKVYVDGYYAGQVDEFDGMTQRLSLAPGRHEILLRKDGYRSHRVRLYLERGTEVKLRYDMEKGMGPDTLDDQAGDRGLDEERERSQRRPDADRPRDDEDRDVGEDAPGPATAFPAPSPEGSRSPGLVALRVTPEDASVYVDGRFFGSARQMGEIELAPGPHRIEIVRPGFRTVERDVLVEAGRTLTLGLALERP